MPNGRSDHKDDIMLDKVQRGSLDRIVDLVAQILSANDIHRPFAIEDSLIEVGLTSVDMVNLMLSTEAEFDIMFPQADITPENFRSVASIDALVKRLGVK